MRRLVLGAMAALILLGCSFTCMAKEFDSVFYANSYQDVVEAVGGDALSLYKHYLTSGRQEGCLPFEGAQPGEVVTPPSGVVNEPLVSREEFKNIMMAKNSRFCDFYYKEDGSPVGVYGEDDKMVYNLFHTRYYLFGLQSLYVSVPKDILDESIAYGFSFPTAFLEFRHTAQNRPILFMEADGSLYDTTWELQRKGMIISK